MAEAVVPAGLQVPARIDAAFCVQLQQTLESASRQPTATALAFQVPAAACLALLRRCERLLRAEPAVVQVNPAGAQVVVVGDTHGQFHDLLTIFRLVGHPAADRCFVVDGDFVDRGAWGLEIVLLLAAWKAALPQQVFLVRGNHETSYCSYVYGFRQEVLAKYGDGKEGEAVFSACQKLFSELPLGAAVAGTALVVHGGLARAPPPDRRASRRSLPEADDGHVTIASLAQMRAAYKGGEDPEPERKQQRLAADVLWSDPASQPGIELGARPGDVGIRFGPDITEAFLRDNGLRLILRGHEGPDARELRPDMLPMSGGYTLDHDTPSGKLYTVFSAPCYPQSGEHYANLGAVAVLEAPGYDEPRFVQYSGAPHPQAAAYHEEASADAEYLQYRTSSEEASSQDGSSGNSSEEEDSGSAAEEEEGEDGGSDVGPATELAAVLSVGPAVAPELAQRPAAGPGATAASAPAPSAAAPAAEATLTDTVESLPGDLPAPAAAPGQALPAEAAGLASEPGPGSLQQPGSMSEQAAAQPAQPAGGGSSSSEAAVAAAVAAAAVQAACGGAVEVATCLVRAGQAAQGQAAEHTAGHTAGSSADESEQEPAPKRLRQEGSAESAGQQEAFLLAGQPLS